MLSYFNFRPSFKLQWCCVLEENYLSNNFNCKSLAFGYPESSPLAYYALWPSGLVITSYASDSVETLLWSLEFVLQIILEHDTTITALTCVYRLVF